METVVRDSTLSRYGQLLTNHILPVFKDKPLDTIKRGDVKDFMVSKVREGIKRPTICLLRDVMSGVFNFAVDEELVDVNPVKGISKSMKLKKEKPEIHLIDVNELAVFLDTAKNHFPSYYPFFLTLTKTGMRLGEALALRWGDVDFHNRVIWVQRSYRRGITDKPKNGKTRRVDMSDRLVEGLSSHLAHEKRDALRKGWGEVPDLVFHQGRMEMEQNYIRRVFKRILRKAGLREVRLHDLRHSFGSILLSSGESPVYVKEQLGHQSIQITVDVYGHWIPSESKKGVSVLDNLTPICTPGASKTEKSHLTACIS